jgi:hypothetical protein
MHDCAPCIDACNGVHARQTRTAFIFRHAFQDKGAGKIVVGVSEERVV